MEHLLLLHGALGSSAQLAPLAESLGNHYNIHTPDFSGHGGRPFPAEPFSMQLFTNDVLAYMEQKGLHSVSIFGYSMGGYVGMNLAKLHPGKVKKIVTLATKYHWDEAVAAKEIKMLDPEKIEQKLPAFAAALANRHAPNDWKELLKKTADMMVAMGNDNPLKTEDYRGISTPALLLLGDKDKMISLDETVAVYQTLPDARLGVLPATQHPIEQVDVELVRFMLERFLN